MRRRSEICGFAFDDLTEIPGKGSAIRLVKSKNDQEGTSKLNPISRLLHAMTIEWKNKHQLEGLILRSVDRYENVGNSLNSGSIGDILNKVKVNLGNKLNNYRFSGHSFRIGAAIDLLESGASLEKIMLKGGWRSQDNPMNYLRS